MTKWILEHWKSGDHLVQRDGKGHFIHWKKIEPKWMYRFTFAQDYVIGLGNYLTATMYYFSVTDDPPIAKLNHARDKVVKAVEHDTGYKKNNWWWENTMDESGAEKMPYNKKDIEQEYDGVYISVDEEQRAIVPEHKRDTGQTELDGRQ